MKIRQVGATALLIGFAMMDQAMAGFFSFTPDTPPPAPAPPTPTTPAVPEFDGPGAIAAIALLVSVGAILYHKMRK